MKRLGELIALVDQPPKDISLEFVPIKHLEADAVRTQLNTLMQGRAKARGSQGDFTILADSRTNKLIVLGPAGQVSDALDLIKSLDVPLGLERVVYAPKVAAAERLNRLIRDSLDPLEADRLYRSTVDSQSNILIATTTAEIHGQIESILEAIDKPAPASQSPIRFYKLENAKATDVLATLRSIEGETGLQGVSIDGLRAKPAEAQEDELPIRGPTPEQINRQAGPRRNSSKGGAVELPDARVMADEPSNTLIVIARPEMHPIYEKLIRRLDIRRPQVLIETVIVSIDTTDGFSLGVELSRRDEVNDGEGTVLNFSSFGLSTVEDDARLTIDPGIGFNGTLISADIADVIVRALKSDSRARVISRPSLLINDNATGTLSSESEEPFSSVNASTSVATTSFGGYSSAGTKITMTPQISEGQHLKLEYEVTLSSFGEEVSENLPPSRQANTLSSEATIPDGYTIIVGGLTREDSSESVDRVPLLGQIPVLEYLFSNRSRSTKQQTLFVFIQATILRDDEFSGLKMLSAQAARDAELADTYPTSNAVEIP
jgi:general secretion pathway protein D